VSVLDPQYGSSTDANQARSSDAIGESFYSHRQPRRAALAPHPSACVEQSSSRIDEATISSIFFSLKLSFSLSSCPLLSRIVFFFLGCHNDFPTPFTHTKTLCLFVWRHALGALSESERVKSEKDELYLFLILFLSLDSSIRSRLPMFSRRGFEGKEIFSIPFAEFLICYAIYSSLNSQ